MRGLAKEQGERQGSALRWRNHKAKTAFGGQWQRRRTEQGFHLIVQAPLQLQGCRQEQTTVIYGNRVEIYRNRLQGGFWQKLQCQRTLNNVSSEDATPTGVGGEEFTHTFTFKLHRSLERSCSSLTFLYPHWVSPQHLVPSTTVRALWKHTEGPCTLQGHEHTKGKKKLETTLLPEPSNTCLRGISQPNYT